MDLKIFAIAVAAVLLIGTGFASLASADSDNGNSGKGNAYGKLGKEIDANFKNLNKAEKKLWIKDKLGKEIGRAQGLVSQLERLSAILKDRGIDTAELDADIAAIKAKLTAANTEINADMRDAAKSLRDALKEFRDQIKEDLRGIIKENREQLKERIRGGGDDGVSGQDENETDDDDDGGDLPSKKIVQGSGSLYLKLNGQAEVEGSGTLTAMARNGDLRIRGGNVSVEGEGTRLEIGDGYIKYKDFAKVTVSGSGFKLKVSGNSIEITAEGSGKVEVEGNGIYRFGNGSNTDFRGKTIIYWNIPVPSPSPTANATVTPSPSVNATVSPSPSVNATPSPNATVSPSPSVSPSPTVNATPSPSASPSPTVNATPSPSVSPTPSPSPSVSPSPSASPSPSPSPTVNATLGSIYGVTEPAGANMYVNDVFKGLTPFLVEGLVPGNFTVKFTKANYTDYITAVAVFPGTTANVTATLTLNSS